MSEGGSIPLEARGLAVVVLIYTCVNAIAAGLVVLMHVRHGDLLGYVPLCAAFVILNTVASFVQQIHLYTSFEYIQRAAYEYQKGGVYTGKQAFTGTNTPLDTALYEIQLYCYNVESLLFLLWIGGLWSHVWRLRVDLSDKGSHVASSVAKVASIVVPAIFIGIANAHSVDRTPGVSLILCDIILACSTAMGLIFLVLVFYKYVSISRYLSGSSPNTGFFARFKYRLKFSLSGSRSSESHRSRMQSIPLSHNHDHDHAVQENSPHVSNDRMPSAPLNETTKNYDKWLLIRFAICFVILCIMQIFLIFYSVFRYFSSKTSYKDAKLDLSAHSAIVSLAIFIPGVTLGLLIFIVFGTTGPFRRDYAEWARSVFSCRGRKQKFDGPLQGGESVMHLTDFGPSQNADGFIDEEQGVADGKNRGPNNHQRVSVQAAEVNCFYNV